MEDNTESPQQEQPITEQENQPEAITDQGLPENQLQDEFNFNDTLFSPPGSTKIPLTRAQKRNNRRRYWGNNETYPIEPEALDVTVQELQKLQETDESLERPHSIADGTPTAAAGEEFFLRDGILYRNSGPGGIPGLEQLVLPRQLRPVVLKLAHDIPMAGHLGRKKTTDRILQRFYWPGIYRDVRDHCRSCEQCQKGSPRGVRKAPLIPLPIMDEPFRRIAMDIVGPLSRSSSGKRYILVICDYATRYPEAVALRNIDANTVAEELLTFFARVGVPEEILTDQGTNFTSQLLAEVYSLLGVKPIKTTPYHPQTDGLVERFNGTLKAMLKKTASDEGRDGDRLLPYLLFAYREVPQASTGFSPFELLYGRHVRGPLDVLRETWEASTRKTESVVSYVMTIQERLAKLKEIVRDNLEDAQKTQKTWYDRHVRSREFQPGDKVLVLLPTSTNKLLAEWRGPYNILRRVGDVTYEIEVSDGRKKKRIFHINMLKKWHSPSAVSFLAQEVTDKTPDEGEDDVLPWYETNGDNDNPLINPGLDTPQRAELDELLTEYQDVLDSRPGRTQVTECRIRTGKAPPIRLPPYRLPYAYRDVVKKELEEMERDGVIERSTSEWAFPIVLVRKKDGSMRMCVDFRRLNAVAEADAYPVPRVDDIIDSLGDARYLTTLDLARGYWQVPVEVESRSRTAFATPYGLFQFRVMPFGLHGAPATFQRMMDQIVQDSSDYAAAYLDDVVVHSKTWEDHIIDTFVTFCRS